MAEDCREIELKFEVDEELFERIRRKLEEAAGPAEETAQKDDYYTPPHRDFMEPEFPFEWLSLRRRGGSVLVNYKHWHPENVENTTHCDEFETPVTDAEALEKLLAALDFRRLVTVEKARRSFVLGGFEIALDAVKGLGRFIEIEALEHAASVEETRKKLFKAARSLGISGEPDTKGYPKRLLEKRLALE